MPSVSQPSTSSNADISQVTAEQITAAAQRLQGSAHCTPVIHSHTLNQQLGAQIFFKCENLQKVGAFKFRGAYNAISQLAPDQQQRGVIAYSSGNHAQAVAKVGQILGLKTVIVMPQNAPVVKRQATAGYGAEIVLYDPLTAKREEMAAQLQAEQGYTLIPPFDHPNVIVGQGTAGLEFGQQVALDMLLVPCGGGGLLSGCAIALKALYPHCTVIGVEPELADDATRSFYSGQLQTVHNPPTIADGTRTAALGQLTFPLIRQYVDQMVTVSEAHILEAVAALFFRLKTVVEPSGALGLAALLGGQVCPKGNVGVLLSGGNIDAETMTKALSTATLAQ